MAGVFQEKNGDTSFARVFGAICIGAIIVGYLVSLVLQKWDVVLVLAGYLSAYGLLAYGVNKWSSTREEQSANQVPTRP